MANVQRIDDNTLRLSCDCNMIHEVRIDENDVLHLESYVKQGQAVRIPEPPPAKTELPKKRAGLLHRRGS
jgi:hypothetical protein